MMSEDESEKEFKLYECANCYLNEYIEVDVDKPQKAIVHYCSYCKSHPECCLKESLKLERILDILHRANISRLPNVLRLMYKVMTKKEHGF